MSMGQRGVLLGKAEETGDHNWTLLGHGSIWYQPKVRLVECEGTHDQTCWKSLNIHVSVHLHATQQDQNWSPPSGLMPPLRLAF